jgi:regulatory protein
MPQITSITLQKKNKERFNVFVDGEYLFPVSLEVLTEFGLSKGQELSPDKIDEIVEAENIDKIFNKVLNFISYRMRTRWEIEQRLDKYLYEAALTPVLKEKFKITILEKVERVGLINDEDFVKVYVEGQKTVRTPLGLQKIKEFLFKKGVTQSIIDKYLVSYTTDIERKGADIVASKKIRKMDLSDYKDKQKLWKFLAGKGYTSDVIKAVVDSKFKV